MTLLLHFAFGSYAQQSNWHGVTRDFHYEPQGKDLVKVSGKHRFNRALYGSNSGFRVEAGDLPEFALYMPGMGGNLKFELQKAGNNKPIINADSIQVIYRAGSMNYVIKDSWLDKGEIQLHVLALMEGEGIIVKIETKDIPSDTKLVSIFGGAGGKKFSRDGDIGADPESSFDLKPEYCEENIYDIKQHIFTLAFHVKKENALLKGIFPPNTNLEEVYFKKPEQPYLKASQLISSNDIYYYLIENAATNTHSDYDQLDALFKETEATRLQLASRITIQTPDSFVNTLGGTLAIAADAIYESPSYLHGAVAWRMRLNAWRGAYAADPLGWHDRAVSHFSSYAKSQLTEPQEGPVVADTALGMARQLEKLGTSMFSSGYICRNPNGDLRPHHYDMNLVFIDQLLEHFKWTGDTSYMRAMWPLIQRHLAWEKRNFDADNNGLYDAYACIWASDALQYNGGDVAYSSAYNYKANKMAAQIAAILKENATLYLEEAKKIHNAIRFVLWLPHLGSYAEYRDNTASCNLHAAAGLWTIYHTLDSEVPDAFQAYQALQYIDHDIPHIPVLATGLKDTGLFVLSTTNWQPYTWSVNNVALAENLHTSLAYWQGGRAASAFKLWKGALMESMLLGTSPGNFNQLSFYDAMRGELYRDFADPIGMAARSLVEGLFGIQPNALDGVLNIKPGFPEDWDHASLHVPDIDIDYITEGKSEFYYITNRFPNQLSVKLTIPAKSLDVIELTLDGQPISFTWTRAIGKPFLEIPLGKIKAGVVKVRWSEKAFQQMPYEFTVSNNATLKCKFDNTIILDVLDSQKIFSKLKIQSHSLKGTVHKENEYGTFFVKLSGDNIVWWQPVNLTFKKKEIKEEKIEINTCQEIDLTSFYNATVTSIFKQKYLSPRSSNPTLQLPVQGIGNWCYPKIDPIIDDAGFRRRAANNNGSFILDNGARFKTPIQNMFNNIVFTSLWDNYPDSMSIPLEGKGKYLSLMMAGSTNPMQSQMENGRVIVYYQDGSSTTLSLRNPENWWPIEQDYYEDGYAFHLNATPPTRIHLKDGTIYNGFAPESMYSKLKGYSERMIEGGAATVLYLKIEKHKKIKSLTLKATTSEVVIGLMAVSIIN